MRLLILSLLAFGAWAQTSDEGTREIWDMGFRSKRPPTPAAEPAPAARPIQYRPVPFAASAPRVAAAPAAQPSSTAAAGRQAVGITIWQLGPASARDTGARLLVQETPSNKVEYAPHRIRLDQPLRVGDRVRLAIELPQEGFLYVVDRERYSDGSFGDPYPIFPVQNLNHGDNKVKPGRLIEIPSQEDPVPALHVSRKDERHMGEELLIVFSPERLRSFPISRSDTPLPPELIREWERELPAATLRLDQTGDGEAWTVGEKAAGADQRLLTQADPMPQSIFVADGLPHGAFRVHVRLEVRR